MRFRQDGTLKSAIYLCERLSNYSPYSGYTLLVFLLYSLGMLASPSVLAEERSDLCWRAFKKTAKVSLTYGVRPLLRTAYYPVTIPKHLIDYHRHAKKGEKGKILRKLFFKDLIPGLGHLGMLALVQGMYTSLNEMDEESDLSKLDLENDVIVYVNYFDPKRDPVWYFIVRNYFWFRFGGAGKAKYIETQSMQDLLLKLNETAKELGPIKRLELCGHGSSGHIGLEGGEAQGLAKALSLVGPLNVFAKEAKITFQSCEVASGGGATFMRDMGKALLKRGGTVYATHRIFYGAGNGLTEFALRPGAAAFGLWLVVKDREELSFKSDGKIVKIQIPVSEN